MSTIEQELEEFKIQIENLKTQMQLKTQQMFSERFKDFFTKYQGVVECIYWTQFTPYFNDGEECVFSVNEPCLKIVGDEDFDEYEGSIIYSSEDLEKLRDDLSQTLRFESDPEGAFKDYIRDYYETHKRYPYGYLNDTAYFKSKWHPSRYISKEALQERIKIAERQLKDHPDLKDDFYKIKTMIMGIDSDTMKMIFGDHVRVQVSPTGIIAEEYGHD